MRLHNLFIILIFSVFLLLAVEPAHAWYSGYNYEQTVTVGSSSDGELSNYQITMNVYSGTGTNSINTLFLKGHALNFPNDIRFTDDDDNDYYYYLVYSNATYAQFIVRVTSIPASGNQLMRVYYGQTSGTSASSASNAYDIYNTGPQNINSLHGGWFTVGTVGTASRNCWYTVPIYYYSSGDPDVKIGVGTTNTFWFGTWSGTPENMPTSVTGGTFTMICTDGTTTNNVYLYDQNNALVSGYPKSFDFGASHVLHVSVGAGASTTVNGYFGGSKGNETAVAYTANPPAMGNWIKESSTGTPTVTIATNVTSGTIPFAVMFNGTSASGIESWSWNFGDGWVSSSENISHLYNGSSGNYTVSLTGTNAYGSGTAYTTITAHAKPNASFTYLAGSAVSGTQTFYFYDTSDGDPATSWAWSFGDNSTNATAQNPTHIYTDAGQYQVIMTATNAYGSSSASINLSVKIDTSITGVIIVTNNNIACGSGITVKLSDQSGVTVVSSTTSGSGAVELTSITPGTTYTLQISGSGIPSYTGKISFSSLDTKFWVDVSTGIITPDSQKVLTTHTVQLRITHWLGTSPEAYMNVVLLLNGLNASATTSTDPNGYVSFLAQSNILYTIWIYNTTQGVNVTRYMDLSGTSYTIDISGSGSWFYNSGAGYSTASNTDVEGSTGNPDQDIVTSATGYYNGASSTITCNYTDISQSTLAVDISIYKPNNTGPMLPVDLLQTYSQVYVGNITQVYNIVDNDPAGKTYIVYFNSTYNLANGGTGHLQRTYTVSFPGPMRLIPGCPASWYKYLAFIILIVIGLIAGKFGVEEASIAICFFASVFFAMQWFYEINAWYMGFVLGAAWIMSIASVWYKREREGRI